MYSHIEILQKLCIVVSRLIGKDYVVLGKLFGDFQKGMRVYNKLGRKISLNEEERAYQLLREWRETVGSKANPDDLIKALHSVRRQDIIGGYTGLTKTLRSMCR